MEKPTCPCRLMLPGRGRTVCKASLQRTLQDVTKADKGAATRRQGRGRRHPPRQSPSQHHPDTAPPGDKAVAGAVASGRWPVASAELCSRLAAVRRCQTASAHGRRLEALHGGRLPARHCLWQRTQRQSSSTCRPRLRPAPCILTSFSPCSKASPSYGWL